jgi:hypothetical protein
MFVAYFLKSVLFCDLSDVTTRTISYRDLVGNGNIIDQDDATAFAHGKRRHPTIIS